MSFRIRVVLECPRIVTGNHVVYKPGITFAYIQIFLARFNARHFLSSMSTWGTVFVHTFRMFKSFVTISLTIVFEMSDNCDSKWIFSNGSVYKSFFTRVKLLSLTLVDNYPLGFVITYFWLFKDIVLPEHLPIRQDIFFKSCLDHWNGFRHDLAKLTAKLDCHPLFYWALHLDLLGVKNDLNGNACPYSSAAGRRLSVPGLVNWLSFLLFLIDQSALWRTVTSKNL